MVNVGTAFIVSAAYDFVPSFPTTYTHSRRSPPRLGDGLGERDQCSPCHRYV
jgi:hypothetical protein